MEKIVSITTDENKFFRQYLEILNPIIRLRGKELDVLAELLYHNNKLKNIASNHRWKIIFDSDTKTQIRSKLNLSEASLNNNLSALRKKGIIKDKIVVKTFWVYPKDDFAMKFKFKIVQNVS